MKSNFSGILHSLLRSKPKETKEIIREIALPRIPPLVDETLLQANGKLLTDEEIERAKDLSAGKHKKDQPGKKGTGNVSVLVVEDENGKKVYGIHPGHIGKGGSGKVRLAQDLDTGQWYAVKLQKAGRGANREFDISKQLGRSSGKLVRWKEPKPTKKKEAYEQHLMVMDLALGITLDDFLNTFSDPQARKNFRTTPLQWMDIAIQALTAIKERVHKKGALHRDIKTTNYKYDVTSGKLIDVDLGEAKPLPWWSSSIRDFPTGTLQTLAPEILAVAINPKTRSTKKVSYREKTEVYSIGLVIAHVLSLVEAKELPESKDPWMQHYYPWKYEFTNNLSWALNKIPSREFITMIKEYLLKITNKDPQQRPRMDEAIEFFKNAQKKLELILKIQGQSSIDLEDLKKPLKKLLDANNRAIEDKKVDEKLEGALRQENESLERHLNLITNREMLIKRTLGSTSIPKEELEQISDELIQEKSELVLKIQGQGSVDLKDLNSLLRGLLDTNNSVIENKDSGVDDQGKEALRQENENLQQRLNLITNREMLTKRTLDASTPKELEQISLELGNLIEQDKLIQEKEKTRKEISSLLGDPEFSQELQELSKKMDDFQKQLTELEQKEKLIKEGVLSSHLHGIDLNQGAGQIQSEYDIDQKQFQGFTWSRDEEKPRLAVPHSSSENSKSGYSSESDSAKISESRVTKRNIAEAMRLLANVIQENAALYTASAYRYRAITNFFFRRPPDVKSIIYKLDKVCRNKKIKREPTYDKIYKKIYEKFCKIFKIRQGKQLLRGEREVNDNDLQDDAIPKQDRIVVAAYLAVRYPENKDFYTALYDNLTMIEGLKITLPEELSQTTQSLSSNSSSH